MRSFFFKEACQVNLLIIILDIQYVLSGCNLAYAVSFTFTFKSSPKAGCRIFLESFTDDALDIYKPGYGKRR